MGYSSIEKLKSNKLRIIVDNNYNLSTLDINLKYFKINYFKKREYICGYSILLNKFLYSKKQIQFNFFSFNSKFNSLKYFRNLLQKLRSLRSLKKIFILVKPIKGGLRGYFNGLCGFFPFKHFFHLIKSQNKLKIFFEIIKNQKFWKFFNLRVKNQKIKAEIIISFLKFVNLKIIDKFTLIKLHFLLKWILNIKKFLILNQKFGLINKFFNLNCLSKKGLILPQ